MHLYCNFQFLPNVTQCFYYFSFNCYVRQKCNDLVEEMDSSLKTTDLFRKKLDDNVRKMDASVAELYQARAQVRQVVDEKAILTSEIERLKGFLFFKLKI